MSCPLGRPTAGGSITLIFHRRRRGSTEFRLAAASANWWPKMRVVAEMSTPSDRAVNDHGDLTQRRLQPVKRCAEAAGSAAAARLALEVENLLLVATAVADKGMNRWVSNGKVITRRIEAGMTAGVDRFRPATATLAFRPGQNIQFGAMRDERDIAISPWALSRRLWL